MADLKTLKEQLSNNGYDKDKIAKSIAYLSTNEQAEKHTVSQLYSLIVKYINAGTNLDGTNVILAGKNMGLITYHGFMNKVKVNHPEVFFDVQLVREGDSFRVAKESGQVVYSHDLGENPFDNYEDKPIKGAYCVVRTAQGESIELLNKRDFDEMQGASRNSSTWKKWPSEFWRKSVIKRACKIYFAEEIAQLEKLDNDDFGLEEETLDETKDAILKAHKDGTAESE